MIVAHAAAVLERLEAALGRVPLYDGDVPDLPPYPYVVLWAGSTVRSSDRLTGQHVNAGSGFQTTCVGLSVAQVRAVRERVHTGLLDARLSVPGMEMSRVRHEASPSPYAELEKDPTVFLAADQWSTFSVPSY